MNCRLGSFNSQPQLLRTKLQQRRFVQFLPGRTRHFSTSFSFLTEISIRRPLKKGGNISANVKRQPLRSLNEFAISQTSDVLVYESLKNRKKILDILNT